MPIYRFLRNSAFGPEEIGAIASAYEDALKVLRLVDRSDPITEIVAKKIIEILETGQRDPIQIRSLALKELGVPPDSELGTRQSDL